MPDLPSVRRALGRGAAGAGTGARRAVGRIGPVVSGSRASEAVRVGPLGRLADRVEQGDLLRLRGRFRGDAGYWLSWRSWGPASSRASPATTPAASRRTASSGPGTGLTLLWLFPVTIVILAIVQEMAARLGVVTGQGLSDLIRDRFGVRWTAFAMLVLLVANVANTVAEFCGAWAATEIFGISRYATVPLVAVAIWALVAVRLLPHRRARVPVTALVFLAYIASALRVTPDWGTVGQAFVSPSNDFSPSVVLLMVALVGTTITPYMQFYLQSAVAEKEHRRGRAASRTGRRDRRRDLDQRHRGVRRRLHGDDPLHGGDVARPGGNTTAADAAKGLEPDRRLAGRAAVRDRPVRRDRSRRHDHADLHRVRDLRGVRLGIGRRQAASATRRSSSASTRSCWPLGALVVLVPGLNPIPLILASRISRACCYRSCSSSWSSSSTTAGSWAATPTAAMNVLAIAGWGWSSCSTRSCSVSRPSTRSACTSAEAGWGHAHASRASAPGPVGDTCRSGRRSGARWPPSGACSMWSNKPMVRIAGRPPFRVLVR